jgi:hypothetical protein
LETSGGKPGKEKCSSIEVVKEVSNTSVPVHQRQSTVKVVFVGRAETTGLSRAAVVEIPTARRWMRRLVKPMMPPVKNEYGPR